MVIRETQLQQMAEAQEDSFVRRMVAHVTNDLMPQYEAQGLLHQDMERFVRDRVADARCYGLLDARDLKVYLDCTVILGRQFDTDPKHPWAGAVLARQDLDGSAKADTLHEHLTFAR